MDQSFVVMEKICKMNGLQLLKLFAQFRKLMPITVNATSVLIFMYLRFC